MASTDYIDLSQLDDAMKDLDKMAVKMADGKAALRRFWEWWKLRRQMGWSRVKVTGGDYFGEHWDGMKPMRVRADGTQIMPWGGVKKVHGRGNVKGRLRTGRTSTRVKVSDVLMQDSKQMVNETMSKPLSLTKDRLGVGPTVEYGKAQNDMRPFVFWQTPDDPNKAIAEFLIEVDKAAKEFANG